MTGTMRLPSKALATVLAIGVFSLAGKCQPPESPAAADKSPPTIWISLRDVTADTPTVKVLLSPVSPDGGTRIPAPTQIIPLTYPDISDVGIIAKDTASGLQELTVVSGGNHFFCGCDNGSQGALPNFVCPTETSPALKMVPEGTYVGARDAEGRLPTSLTPGSVARLDLSASTACQTCNASDAPCRRWTPQHGGQSLLITATNGAGTKTIATVRLQLN